MDPRAGHIGSGAFPAAVQTVLAWPDQWMAGQRLRASDAVVMLSHDPRIDDRGIRAALAGGAGHVAPWAAAPPTGSGCAASTACPAWSRWSPRRGWIWVARRWLKPRCRSWPGSSRPATAAPAACCATPACRSALSRRPAWDPAGSKPGCRALPVHLSAGTSPPDTSAVCWRYRKAISKEIHHAWSCHARPRRRPGRGPSGPADRAAHRRDHQGVGGLRVRFRPVAVPGDREA